MENLFLAKPCFHITGRKRGFTLLEVLIVIAIIGILVSLGVVSYSSAQKKARDSKRRGDMKAMQSAWEQYYADNNGSYPSSCSITATYMPGGLPTDPKTNVAYAGNCTATNYCLCSLLESDAGNAADSLCTYATGSYFCVSNLQ
jgi:prepilin-type N-terminal cleavage/methylation domain-containing protein